MKEMNRVEKKARSFIEEVLIPEVKKFETVTRTITDFVKDGVEGIIDEITGLVREYGLCLKIIFEQGKSSYQFWYETE